MEDSQATTHLSSPTEATSISVPRFKTTQEKEVHGPSNTWSPSRREMHLNVDVLIITSYGQPLHL